MDFDLNLNLEPEDSHRASQLDRIRLLESVVSRGRHHRRRPPPLPPHETTTTTTTNLDLPCKIDGGIHLLAKALAMDSSSEQINPSKSSSTTPSLPAIPRNPSGSVFDCNICYSLSNDPVVTCCGHIFCWPCFHALPNSDSCYSKECPVCQGEVLETDVTPIYGGGSAAEPDLLVVASSSSNDPIAVKIPPRPRARRIVSTRSRSSFPYPLRATLPRASELHPSWMPVNRPAEGIGNAATANSIADAHSETLVSDRIGEGHAMGVRSYSSSRRARNESSEIGSTLRNQRRRGEWMS